MADEPERESAAEPQEPRTSEAQEPTGAGGTRLERMWRFARAHPVVSVLGAATIGLFGGIEVAGGVLIGAGVAAALRAPEPGRMKDVERAIEEPVRKVRHRARSILSRAPREVRERARAVVAAARGRNAPETDGDGHPQPT